MGGEFAGEGPSSRLVLNHEIEFADCDDLFANLGQLGQRFRLEEKGAQPRDGERFHRLFQRGVGSRQPARARSATNTRTWRQDGWLCALLAAEKAQRPIGNGIIRLLDCLPAPEFTKKPMR